MVKSSRNISVSGHETFYAINALQTTAETGDTATRPRSITPGETLSQELRVENPLCFEFSAPAGKNWNKIDLLISLTSHTGSNRY
jgi:hypothetical protein